MTELGGRSALRLFKLAIAPVLWALAAFLLLCRLTVSYESLSHYFNLRLPNLPSVERDVYLSMVGTIAQASAAILALFFAAISVVASTSYSKLATDVRSLIAQDDLNRRYLRLLAHLTAVCFIALVSQSLGYKPNALVVVYIGGLAVFSVLGFFAIGARTFALFSPARLMAYPNRYFVRALDSVTPHSKRWLDASFQLHAGKLARRQLEIVEELVESAMSDDHPSMRRAVHEIALAVHRFLRLYASRKSSIPGDSEWFAKKAQFARLQLGMGAEAEVALKSGVIPPAASVPDHKFVESQCDEILVRCLEHTLTEGSIEDAISQLFDFHTTATIRARLFQQTEAVTVAQAVCGTLTKWLVETETKNNLLARLQAVDVACVIGLSPILNTSQSLCGAPMEQLLGVTTSILSGNVKALHSSNAPPQLLSQLIDILRKILFERSVEDEVLTQRWYVDQLVAGIYADFVRDVVKVIVETVESLFLAPARKLLAAKKQVEATIWLQRSIEACSKAHNQISSLGCFYSELKLRHYTEAPWYALDETKALGQVATARSETIRLLGECVPGLLNTVEDDNLPDLIGQSRLWMADELLHIMESDTKELTEFTQLFAAYFDATIAISQRMFDLAQQPRKSSYTRAGMDAMLDVLELSGLAILFSELGNGSFGGIVCEIWTKYLSGMSNTKGLLSAWLEPVDKRHILPILSPSNSQRFEWERRFARILQERGISGSRDEFSFRRRRKNSHPSAVIRSLHVHMGHFFVPPSEYFAAIFLAPRAHADGVSIPTAVRRCSEAIEREQREQDEDEDE